MNYQKTVSRYADMLAPMYEASHELPVDNIPIYRTLIGNMLRSIRQNAKDGGGVPTVSELRHTLFTYDEFELLQDHFTETAPDYIEAWHEIFSKIEGNVGAYPFKVTLIGDVMKGVAERIGIDKETFEKLKEDNNAISKNLNHEKTRMN